MNAIIEHLKICRIDHWLKNIFIVFGHVVAVVLIHNLEVDGAMITKAVLSLIPACLIASANYILNEILDAPFDKLHPTKKHRGIPAGKVSVPILWCIKGVLIVVGFWLGYLWFDNRGYLIALGLLLFSGLVYNIRPVRLKDRAFVDVIAESFNNPIRLWLGWYALAPAGGWTLENGMAYDGLTMPPAAIMLAWWSFGALLMTGKRYAEYRFIDNPELSGKYRKSFEVYTNNKLIIAMITYANLFCFFAGIALTDNPQLTNFILVFPMVILAVIAYFSHAMSEIGAKLEPEQLLQNPWIIVCTSVTALIAVWLLWAHKAGKLEATQILDRL